MTNANHDLDDPQTAKEAINPSFAPEAPAPIAAIEEILAQRQVMRARERDVIEGLNAALAKIGYKIVPLRGPAKPQPRLGSTAEPATSDTVKRRGRPPKAKTECQDSQTMRPGLAP